MTEPPEARILRGERRVATVVFSDLAGYTTMNEALDPEDVIAALERVRAMAEQVAAAHGGIVNQVVGDESVLVFGMPVAHDDDALRAVRAALALHDEVDRLGAEFEAQLGVALRLHTGINTGLVLFTASDERGGAYAITGDTVNTAARLRSEAAAGEVLVGPSTQRAIAPFFETTASAPLQLKGKAQPLLAHRVVGRSGLHSRFDVARARGLHAHVGRERELARMRARLALVANASDSGTAPALCGAAAWAAPGADGALQAVAVVGDPGTGKSRLLYELRMDAEGSGCDLLWGRCEPFGSVPPYQPFLDALRTRLGLQENASGSESAARVSSELGEIAPELAPQIPALLEFLSLGSPALSGPPAAAAALHEQGADAVCALLAVLSRRAALVVILEDWHWADEASERLLAHLLSALRSARVLVAISYRPERKPVWERRLDELIRLAPLGAAETAALARAVLKVDGVSEGLGQLLFERTAGNPLFVEEFCRALGEAGCLVVDDNAARLSATAATTALPDGVQAAIRSRIDRLTAPERRLVALASVIGMQFSASMLELVADVPADVAATLARLEQTQLVRSQGSAGSYAFGHAFIQQVTYDGLLKSDRRTLHARVAEGLESAFGEGRLLEHYESLARHFGAAGSAEKAAHYSDLAGDKAARAYALESAAQQYRRAIEYLEALPPNDASASGTAPALRGDAALRRRVDMTLKWGRASIWRPSLDQMDRLRGSVALARGIGYERGAAWALYWLGWHDYTLGNQTQAISDFEASLQAATHLREQRLMAQASANLAYCHAAGRNHARAESYLEQTLSLQKSSSLERLWGDIYSLGYRGLIAGDRGEFTQAYALLRDALASAAALNEVAMRGSVLTQLGIVQAQQGAFDALRSTAAELRTIGERVEAGYLLAMSKSFEGYAELHIGQVGCALPALFEAVDALEEMSLMLAMSFNYACLAEALAQADQPARAERVARQALARGACGDRMGDVMAARALAIAAVRCRVPDVAAAEAHLAVASALADRHGLARECVLVRYTRAEVLHAVGDRAQAREQARALRPELERMQMGYYLARCAAFEAG